MQGSLERETFKGSSSNSRNRAPNHRALYGQRLYLRKLIDMHLALHLVMGEQPLLANLLATSTNGGFRAYILTL
jgi:hypothetical protein